MKRKRQGKEKEKKKRRKRKKRKRKRIRTKPKNHLVHLDMEQFFNKGIRGGQSFISIRRAKGNEDPKTPGNHLLYVDSKLEI